MLFLGKSICESRLHVNNNVYTNSPIYSSKVGVDGPDQLKSAEGEILKIITLAWNSISNSKNDQAVAYSRNFTKRGLASSGFS